MRYGLIESGEILKKGDEIYSPSLNQWFPIDSEAYRYHPCLFPVRRLLDQPKPVETFTIPCGPWIGCTGTVFMDGEDKKVRLENVFVGGKPLVIDFPRYERYDEDHRVMEDNEIIEINDYFCLGCNGPYPCNSSIGMRVREAKDKFAGTVFIRRF